MRIPSLEGIIDRRILINFKVEPALLRSYLPAPFKPRLFDGSGILGIDLIRFRALRAKGLPSYLGYSSENAVHRIAVEWEELGQIRTGMYVPRLDTDSLTTSMAGGRVFPGFHHYSRFQVKEADGRFEIMVKNRDQHLLSIHARESKKFPFESIFREKEAAARFFARDRIAYSSRFQTTVFDGVELKCRRWKVFPLHVSGLSARYFVDQFPGRSIYFDHALLMKQVKHEWHARNELISPRPVRFEGLLL